MEKYLSASAVAPQGFSGSKSEVGKSKSDVGKSDTLFVGNAPFLNVRRVQLVQLAARHTIPATYPGRELR
jgi:hypothetical protein